jgi:hypothetical protein
MHPPPGRRATWMRCRPTDRSRSSRVGVQVYVVGAGVMTSSELAAARILAIQDFWQRDFAASGAELRPDRYGAALMRFP